MTDTPTETMWDRLPEPFLALAPMADVTDVAFRAMFARYGRPDIFWTEFVSADGLCSPGREILRDDLLFEENQRPIVAQLFTANPDRMRAAAALVRELGFDGLDINMGCPDRSVEKQGCGSAMIRNPDTARAVIAAAKESGLPVSVKTRIGYARDETETWIPFLLRNDIAALTVHLRTRNEMSRVPAQWQLMRRIVSLRDSVAPRTRILGNGDVKDTADARSRAAETGCDGVMIGRGVFGNPWFFSADIQREDVGTEERLRVLVEHTRLFETMLPRKNFAVMKKHCKAYVADFDGAKELRAELMDADDAETVSGCVGRFLRDGGR